MAGDGEVSFLSVSALLSGPLPVEKRLTNSILKNSHVKQPTAPFALMSKYSQDSFFFHPEGYVAENINSRERSSFKICKLL